MSQRARKFTVTLIVVVFSAVFLGWGRLSGQEWTTLMRDVLGIFVAGNVAEWIAQRGQQPKGGE